jgi:ubiquinone/menaquinone biosynthesis C-methylase UbiE
MSTRIVHTDYADVTYLQAAGELLRPAKLRSYALMQVTGGQQILDVGCGPGLDTVALAMHVQNWGGFTRAAAKAGAVTQDEVDQYLAGLERAAQAGTFFAMLGGVIAAGRKSTA